MKTFVLTLALAAVASFADAQGTIQIANNAGTRFRINGALPRNASDGGPAAGTFSFGVFVGATADGISCDPVLPLAYNSATGGLITAANPQSYQIPGFAPDSTVFMVIRGWESRFGADWIAAAQGGLSVQSDVRSVVLGPASGPGTVIWSSTDPTKFQGMNSLIPSSITIPPHCVPEPRAVGLIGLGLGGLLMLQLRRRKSLKQS